MNPQLLHIPGAVGLRLTDGILIGQAVIGEVIERVAGAGKLDRRDDAGRRVGRVRVICKSVRQEDGGQEDEIRV